MNCYKFTTRAKFRSLAAAEGLLTEDDELITNSHTHAIDEVGIITKGGSYDPETGEVITPPTVLAGWHVNYIGEPPEAWGEFLVYPSHPNRVFAS
jgi:hypothetical protein